jgi:Late embryogenesis abundant protein
MTETDASPNPKAKAKSNKRRCLYACLGCGLVIFLLAIVFVILAFTLFRVRDPSVSVTSTRVAGVAPQVTLPNLSMQFNITLDIIASVHNPNRASFTYGSGQTNLTYRGTQVGQAIIEPGRIPNHGSGPVRLSLTVDAAKFSGNLGALTSDVLNGTIAFDTYTMIPGRVAILGFIKHHAVARSTCHLEIGLPDMNVKSQECDNKTSL